MYNTFSMEKMHEVNVLDLHLLEADAFYIMDRGFEDIRQL